MQYMPFLWLFLTLSFHFSPNYFLSVRKIWILLLLSQVSWRQLSRCSLPHLAYKSLGVLFTTCLNLPVILLLYTLVPLSVVFHPPAEKLLQICTVWTGDFKSFLQVVSFHWLYSEVLPHTFLWVCHAWDSINLNLSFLSFVKWKT